MTTCSFIIERRPRAMLFQSLVNIFICFGNVGLYFIVVGHVSLLALWHSRLTFEDNHKHSGTFNEEICFDFW